MSRRTASRARGLLAVGLLVAALAAAAGGGLAALSGGGADVVTAENTTSYLRPAGADGSRAWVGEPGVDASVAVTASAQRLHGRFERQAFDGRYFAAGDPAERARLFREGVDALERRVGAIAAARDDAVAAHSAGELTTGSFVRTLARVQAASARAERLRSLLQNRSILAGSPQQSFRADLQAMQVDVASLRGPATERLVESLVGRFEGTGLYVETVGGEGLVVATLDDGTYYRDALDASQRDVGGRNQFTNGTELGIGVAYGRAAELYPWIFRANVAPGPATPYGNTSVYSITVDHSQGRLSTYLDGATENVFRETQRKRLRVVPLDHLGAGTGGGLRLSVNGTHPTGPLHVRLVGAADGDPVDGVVRVEGSRVGATGDDGELWTIQPAGPFAINATARGQSVSVSLP